jgi:hypothetical protein
MSWGVTHVLAGSDRASLVRTDSGLTPKALTYSLMGSILLVLVLGLIESARAQVFVNGTEASYTVVPCSDSTLNYLYFNYSHSIKKVIIIPESSSLLLQSIFMVTTLLGAIIYRKKRLESRSKKMPATVSA